MQEMEWMSLDETEYDNIEEVGTHLFDPTTRNVDDACDSEDNSE